MNRLLSILAVTVTLSTPMQAIAQFATVTPTSLGLSLGDGDVHTQSVSIRLNPFCIRPFDVDVIASTPSAVVSNLTGIVVNGCGGDESTFDIEITGTGSPQAFDLQFVDAGLGGVLGTIPVIITPDGAGSLHGTKWRDDDGDGTRGADEPGLPGVTIYVDLNNNGTLDRNEPQASSMRDDPNTRVDESGHYWLEGIAPGNLVIREVPVDGMRQTFPPKGAHGVALRGGAIEGLDFGNQPLPSSSLHGRKWVDRNGNGERDPDEPGLAGVTIYSDLNVNGRHDTGEPSTVTMADDPNTDVDEAGLYWLMDLGPAIHVVREVVPDGFSQTFPTCGGSHVVRLDEGAALDGLDFGNHAERPDGSIHGVKWLDHDGDGVRDDGEPGLPGVVIYVDLDNDGRRDRREPATRSMRDDPNTDFDESGLYWLEGLEPGRHVVREVVPDGFVQTFPSGNGSHAVQVDDGTTEGVDFGNRRRPTVSIHGTKWLDRNGNQRRDAREPGLPGVLIYVDRNRNGRRDRGEPATRTLRDDPRTDFDEAGRYWLEGLRPGRHVVREVVPRGFRQTFPGGNGRHVVRAREGTVEGIDFGNRRGRGPRRR